MIDLIKGSRLLYTPTDVGVCFGTAFWSSKSAVCSFVGLTFTHPTPCSDLAFVLKKQSSVGLQYHLVRKRLRKFPVWSCSSEILAPAVGVLADLMANVPSPYPSPWERVYPVRDCRSAKTILPGCMLPRAGLRSSKRLQEIRTRTCDHHPFEG